MLTVSVVSPERTLFEGQAESIVAPGTMNAARKFAFWASACAPPLRITPRSAFCLRLASGMTLSCKSQTQAPRSAAKKRHGRMKR